MGLPEPRPPSAPAAVGVDPDAPVQAETIDSIRALMMIRAYRVRGHLIASLDPLSLDGERHHPELDPKSYGFSEVDYDRPIYVDGVLGLKRATLREVLAILKQTYCARVGVEFMHIQYPERKAWVQRMMEGERNRQSLSPGEKTEILRHLHEAEGFERFLDVKYGRRQALLARRVGERHPRARSDHRPGRAARRGGNRHRHGPSRAAQRADQHPGQVLCRGLLRIPGRRHQRWRRAGLGRRQVSPGRLGRPRPRQWQDAPHLAHAQPLAPGGRQPGRAGQGAGQAGDAGRQGPRAGHGPADSRRRRARRPGNMLRGLRAFGAARATAPAARSISSSTTRSASPPARARRAPRPIRRRWRRSSRHRSST